MTPAANDIERREVLVAALLWYGTWFASALIAAGVLLTMVAPRAFLVSGLGVMKAGVAVFILLPIARVALMLVLFVRERDYVYAAIAALVLAIIAAGVLVEV